MAATAKKVSSKTANSIGDAALASRLSREIEGDVRFDAFSRGRYSTDASHYQIEPIGVVIPKTDKDIARVIAIAEKHSGNHQLNLDVEDGGDCFRIRADSGVAISDELIDSFAVLVGPDNMSFTRM